MAHIQTNTIIQCQQLIAAGLPFDYQGDALTLELNAGEMVSIIGPDESGKSQWLRTLCGLDDQDSGTLHIHGIDTLDISGSDWSMMRTKVAYVHAETALLSAASGLLNTLIPALYHRLDRTFDGELLTEKALQLLEEIDPKLNLEDLPAYISKEQQFKIAVARAMLLNPDILVLDLPFTYFSNDSRRLFQKFLNRRVADGMALLIATNDISYALNYSDRIIFTEEENLYQFNSKQEVLDSEIVAINDYITPNSQ